ncbi:hypothetical protein DSECCO2_483240 [anaerobic digester metagenome]
MPRKFIEASKLINTLDFRIETRQQMMQDSDESQHEKHEAVIMALESIKRSIRELQNEAGGVDRG